MLVQQWRVPGTGKLKFTRLQMQYPIREREELPTLLSAETPIQLPRDLNGFPDASYRAIVASSDK